MNAVVSKAGVVSTVCSVHRRQCAVAHRHAGQQQCGVGVLALARRENHRHGARQRAEAAVGALATAEHRVGVLQGAPQRRDVLHALACHELAAAVASRLHAGSGTHNRLAVLGVESNTCCPHAAVHQQPGHLFFCHNLFILCDWYMFSVCHLRRRSVSPPSVYRLFTGCSPVCTVKQTVYNRRTDGQNTVQYPTAHGFTSFRMPCGDVANIQIIIYLAKKI